MSNLDPIESSEIMELLGANYVDLEDAQRYRKIKNIIDYFSGREDKRHVILKILSGKSGDRIDILWDWIQLVQERSDRIRSLAEKEFTGDIQKEIADEYITRDNIKLLKSQLEKRITEERERREVKEALKQGRKEEEKHEKDIDRATEKAMTVSEMENMKKTLEEIEQINLELEKY